MEYFLLVLGVILIFVGFLGSFLPVLPGPSLSWVGLLLVNLVSGIETDYWTLGVTLFVTILVTILDYVIPAQGTKRFGGNSYGVWGTNIGLLIGIFTPVPFGFIIGPFVGALVGELIYDAKDINRALKAAFGSFIGFLTGTFIKIVVCIVFMVLFFMKVYNNWSIWF